MYSCALSLGSQYFLASLVRGTSRTEKCPGRVVHGSAHPPVDFPSQGGSVKIKGSVTTRSTGGRVRLIAAASGLIAASAFIIPTASAASSAPVAGPEEATALVKSL